MDRIRKSAEELIQERDLVKDLLPTSGTVA
jgi:hypothetical protein